MQIIHNAVFYNILIKDTTDTLKLVVKGRQGLKKNLIKLEKEITKKEHTSPIYKVEY